MSDPVQLNSRLFWVNRFNAMQFTVVFRRFYENILKVAEEADGFVLDWKLSDISNRNYCVFPAISRQVEFGYSDLTSSNAKAGFLDNAFLGVANRLKSLDKVRNYFKVSHQDSLDNVDMSDIQIPTYVINLPSRVDRREHVLSQFSGRKEFDVRLFPAVQSERGADGLWQSICRIVKTAQESDDEVIVICEDDHIFTSDYDKDRFIRNVIEAGNQGCQLLSGGIGGLGDAVRISADRWWVSWLWCTQFIVLYRSAFSKVLQASFAETDVADEFLSRILSHKQTLWPFISEQKDFGYSDVTASNNKSGTIVEHFSQTKNRFARLVEIEPLKAEAEKLEESRQFLKCVEYEEDSF